MIRSWVEGCSPSCITTMNHPCISHFQTTIILSRGLHLSLSKTQPVSKEMLFWWVPPWNCCSNVFPLSTTGSNGNCIKDKATWDRLKNLVRLKHKVMHLPKEENYYAAENASSGCTFHKHAEHQVSTMQTTVFKATML